MVSDRLTAVSVRPLCRLIPPLLACCPPGYTLHQPGSEGMASIGGDSSANQQFFPGIDVCCHPKHSSPELSESQAAPSDLSWHLYQPIITSTC
ncbi:hypothetical protein RRG08_057006 [Elysia crispata]|uniref:Uncharacterized protein n=1 Tax=Elysia crispata TaxID=231223 RepID=A0AAE0Z650_9GAST|nr:hypothetical protein RRG08_057006 [Elysia crispata]